MMVKPKTKRRIQVEEAMPSPSDPSCKISSKLIRSIKLCTWRNGRVAVHELGCEGDAECGDQHNHQDGADGAETRWGLLAAGVVRHVELGWAGLLLPSWELIVKHRQGL